MPARDVFHEVVKIALQRIALEDDDPERLLYLAIPLDIYKRFFKNSFIQTVIQRNQIPLLVYDIEKQEIAQWIT